MYTSVIPAPYICVPPSSHPVFYNCTDYVYFVFKKIADDYWQKWDYPCCIGALDGKHVLIEPPNGEGSQNSIVLMALVSADLKYVMVSMTSGRIFNNKILYYF